jgi:hypothetical protein
VFVFTAARTLLLRFEIVSIKGFSERKQKVAGENHIIKSFKIFTTPDIIPISNEKKRLYGRGMHHVWETRETYT